MVIATKYVSYFQNIYLTSQTVKAIRVLAIFQKNPMLIAKKVDIL